MKLSDYGKFNRLDELVTGIDMGLDIEFYLYDIRYCIGSDNDGLFIAVCPDGDGDYYADGAEMVNKHIINDKRLCEIWQDILIRSM